MDILFEALGWFTAIAWLFSILAILADWLGGIKS